MFGKLLKYDMQAIGRSFWIIAASMLAASVVGGASLRLAIEFSSDVAILNLIPVGAIFLFILCFAALILSMAVTEILLIARFYKNLFTDEGYLTFTLPVTRRQILFSKFVNALIWLSIHALLLVAGMALLFTIGTLGVDPNASPFFSFTVTDFDVAFPFEELGGWVIVYAIELVLLLVCSLVYMVSMIYFAFAIGCTCAKKNKVLASIGIWYLTSMIAYMVFVVILIFGMIACGIGLAPLLNEATSGTIAAVIALILAMIITVIATISTIFYQVTRGRLERKLNLA